MITSVFAVLSKYVLRSRSANVFNPAALAIVVSFCVFHIGQNWWGALVDLKPIAKIVMLAAGVFMVNLVNKMPLVVTFLGIYFAQFTITAFVSNPLPVAESFRTPDVDAALYFAFFILTDPPTSPAKYRDQLIFGAIVAVTSFVLFEVAGVVFNGIDEMLWATYASSAQIHDCDLCTALKKTRRAQPLIREVASHVINDDKMIGGLTGCAQVSVAE
jgi:Na+-translocating ferredoxin:NAD+ oxidoreductase RnfD subunit